MQNIDLYYSAYEVTGMEYRFNCVLTDRATFSLHSHKQHEITIFTKGNGVYRLGDTTFSFSAGTVVVVPPNTMHSSLSTEQVERIYLCGNFETVLPSDAHAVFRDEPNGEGEQLARLILHNRFGNSTYVNALCESYLQFIVGHIQAEDAVHQTVQTIIRRISDTCYDTECNVTEILRESGYAVDYIRAAFKQITGKSPHTFLTEQRVEHARFLIETYHNVFSLAQIGEQCGYGDYVHFSKTFKSIVGSSPREYLKTFET